MPLSFAASTGIVPVVAGDVVVTWWSFTETTGTGRAVLTILDGADATGQELATITLLAGESIREVVGPPGLFCTRGVVVNVTTGTARGTLAVVNA